MRLHKLCKPLSMLSIFYIGIFYLIQEIHRTYREESETDSVPYRKSNASKQETKNKIICLWTAWNGKDDWNVPFIKEPDFLKRINCPQTRCSFVFPSKRDSMPVTEYDAIVFNGIDLRLGEPLPSERKPKQIYVFVSMEPPTPWWLGKMNFDVLFNYTSENVTESLQSVL